MRESYAVLEAQKRPKVEGRNSRERNPCRFQTQGERAAGLPKPKEEGAEPGQAKWSQLSSSRACELHMRSGVLLRSVQGRISHGHRPHAPHRTSTAARCRSYGVPPD